MPFDNLMLKIKDAQTIRATRGILGDQINTKVFLASYMIALHPDRVFDQMGLLEQAVFNAATPLVRVFTDSVAEGRLSRGFQELLTEYNARFLEWKQIDQVAICRRIKHALVDLYRYHDGTNEAITTHIERLRLKLTTIAGAAALMTFDMERAAITQPVVEVPYTNHMSNEQLAHELLVNPSYQIAVPDMSRFDGAFWALLLDDLKLQPQPAYGRLLLVLKEACKFWTALDVEAIRLHTNAGTFTFADGCQLLRLYDIESEETAEGVCDGIRRMMSKINVENIRAANERLGAIAQTIADHGVEYEIGKFAAKFHSGSITIAKTRALVNLTLQTAPIELHDQTPASLRKLFAMAVVSVIVDPTIEIPETLELDAACIKELRVEFTSLVNIKAMITVVRARGFDMAEDEEVPAEVVSEVEMAETVRTLFRRRIAAYLVNCVVHGVTDTHDIYYNGVSKERADRFVNRFCRMCEINGRVHDGTYEHLWLEFIGYLTPLA